MRLDRRFTAGMGVELKRVSECEHGSVPSIIVDYFPSLNRSENLLILETGYWYGNRVRFWLFDERLTGLGPKCIEADIILLSFDGRPVARQHIRAERPPASAPDGGVPPIDWDELERLASPDAGAP